MPLRRRTSWLALLFSTLLVLLASAQSLHEQLAHQHLTEQCEYCLQAVDPNSLLPPLLIALPALIIDLAPSVLLTFAAPRRVTAGVGARAPPQMASTYNY